MHLLTKIKNQMRTKGKQSNFPCIKHNTRCFQCKLHYTVLFTCTQFLFYISNIIFTETKPSDRKHLEQSLPLFNEILNNQSKTKNKLKLQALLLCL